MTSTFSQSSRRYARYFFSRAHLDRLLLDDHFGTTRQDRIVRIDDALQLVSVQTGKNATLNPEELTK